MNIYELVQLIETKAIDRGLNLKKIDVMLVNLLIVGNEKPDIRLELENGKLMIE